MILLYLILEPKKEDIWAHLPKIVRWHLAISG
jgi:hypothetical protein